MVETTETAVAPETVASLANRARVAAMGLPMATPEQIQGWSFPTAPVYNGAILAEDIFGGNPGSKAAWHNAALLACAGSVVTVESLKTAIQGLTFTDTRGNSSPGKYNPNHIARLCSEPCPKCGHLRLVRVAAGITVNPLWLETMATQKPATTPEATETPVADKGKGKGKGKGKDKSPLQKYFKG